MQVISVLKKTILSKWEKRVLEKSEKVMRKLYSMLLFADGK